MKSVVSSSHYNLHNTEFDSVLATQVCTVHEDVSGLVDLTEHLAQALRFLTRIREVPDLNPGLDIVSFGLHLKHFFSVP
jgi:hypothetical protein